MVFSHSSVRIKSGGQYAPKQGGQFGAKHGGHIKMKRGGQLVRNIQTATDVGGATAEFGKNSLGSSTASVGANFAGSNPSPAFMGMAPAIEVSSAVSITENLKTNQLFVSLDISSKQFPATEGLIQDKSGNTIFLKGAAAYGGPSDLINANKQPVVSIDLIIGINNKGEFQNVTFGNKTYTIEEFNKIGTSKSAGPLPREDKDKDTGNK